DDAKAALQSVQLKPDEYLLPWKVQSFPKGARARLQDGTERVTPFVLESAFGEKITMTLELEGHEPMTLSVDAPADHFLWFSRTPERAWPTAGRVEALPVSVGEDHVVCDRAGGIARLSKGGHLAWHAKLASLGGVGRAPVFMPRNQGRLLLVTEDGE